jgi:hypothetical protein
MNIQSKASENHFGGNVLKNEKRSLGRVIKK